eukprot:5779647-Prymnesium_polylepis.1
MCPDGHARPAGCVRKLRSEHGSEVDLKASTVGRPCCVVGVEFAGRVHVHVELWMAWTERVSGEETQDGRTQELGIAGNNA